MSRSMTTKFIGAFVASALALFGLAGCASQESYQPPEKTPTLSSPTIAQDGVLRVGVHTGNAPLAGQPASSSKIVGLDVDVAAALADQFGLKLELVDVGTDAEAALTNGSVDIVMGVDKADSAATFWTSEAYLPTAVALFALPANDAVPTNEEAPVIAAQTSSKSSWAVSNEFESGTLVTTDDLKSAFAKLESGDVQYVAADAVIGTYAAHSAGYDVHIVALMQQPSGYAVGVLDSNAELKQAVSDALTSLTGTGIVGVIETKWLGSVLDLAQIPLTAGATATATDDSSASEDTSADESEGGDEGAAQDEGAEDAPVTDDSVVYDNTGAVDNGGIVDDGSYVDDTTYTDPGVAPDQTYDQGVGGDANGTGDAVADDGTYTDQAA